MPVGGIRGSHRRWRDTGMTGVYIYLIGGFAVMLLVILVHLPMINIGLVQRV